MNAKSPTFNVTSNTTAAQPTMSSGNSTSHTNSAMMSQTVTANSATSPI